LTLFRRAFLLAAIGWAFVIPLAPFAASQPPPARAWYALAFLIYSVGSVVCHQLPARSFELWSTQMPVCARCTGIYLGAAVIAIASLFRWKPDWSAPALDPRQSRYALALAALPAAATLAFEWITGNVPSNLIRALSGLPLGAVVVVVILSVIRERDRVARTV
jgi:uncharacterized membrane protein